MAELPDTYDLIVVGTGMPESIIAAAAARIGKSVLHLDRNDFYGGLWASFNFEYLIRWINMQKDQGSEPVQRLVEVNWLEQLNDDEHLVLCPKSIAVASGIVQKSYLWETASANSNSEGKDGEQECNVNIHQSNIDDHSLDDVGDSAIGSQEDSQETADATNEELGFVNNIQGDNQVSDANQQIQSNLDENNQSNFEHVANSEGNTHDVSTVASTVVIEEQRILGESYEGSGNLEISPQPVLRWTTEDFFHNRHKFNIDLAPKLLFSRGPLVELLISSNTSRYADFQSVNRILTLINGHLEEVPCSKADVFSTKSVNVVEKRMLMKLLTFCLEYQKYPEEYRGYEGRPFVEFLRSRKITPNIEHYILHAIAMKDESCLTLEGLQATQKFMESLGRFGNSPFLWTCYGSAELPQCFCRLCAVFGGIYYLGRDVDAIILNSNNHCAGIISQGQKLTCTSLVMEYGYSPLQYHSDGTPEMISRAIYVIDGSILPAERQQNTLLRLPPISGVRNAITVLEFGSLSFICPRGLYLIHMTCRPLKESVAEDFLSAEIELFMSREGKEIPDTHYRKPKVLWSLHFRHRDITVLDINCKVPSGVFFTSPPGLELDYEHAVTEAQEIFDKMFPGEDFLPRAPDPEDVLLEGLTNPGTEAKHDSTHLDDDDLEKQTNTSEELCLEDQINCRIQSSHTQIDYVEERAETTESDTHKTDEQL